MKTFAENISTFVNVDHLQRIELTHADGRIAGILENKQGSQGSLKLYHHLWKKWGCINADAAKEGLALYAEHTEDAKNHPGKHPNIDRLLSVIEHNASLSVKIIAAVMP
ncbi:MAG: DUF2322 family protein [Methylophilaceae bacterium]